MISPRPPALQVAALCHRGSGAETEVLLITSRGTGRWVLPKGWPIKGLSGAGAALREAYEEAGVQGIALAEPVGRYGYDKILDSGLPLPCEAAVYAVQVTGMLESYPEAGQRRLAWQRPARAAELVAEPGLQALLRRFTAPPAAAAQERGSGPGAFTGPGPGTGGTEPPAALGAVS
ncbi:NUDIX hydrolase [Oceanicella sp. SM1341]|uniref:NUDIX hydrolase n=1 Tax=Oceanicella sp. SM1341 TaxID=1548889 RepID=UPI003514F283